MEMHMRRWLGEVFSSRDERQRLMQATNDHGLVFDWTGGVVDVPGHKGERTTHCAVDTRKAEDFGVDLWWTVFHWGCRCLW